MSYRIIFQDRQPIEASGPKEAVASARTEEKKGNVVLRIENGPGLVYRVDELEGIAGTVKVGSVS